MGWSNQKTIAFLEILQTEPCLWNPKLKSFRNRGAQSDAWRRVIATLPFKTTVEKIKKRKESLMGYYRTHLNKIKKSLESEAGDEVYTTNWFAFETMDSFLRGVYDSRTSHTETHDELEERSGGINDANEYSSRSSTEQEVNGTRPRENSQNYGKKRQMGDENDDEYEMFGRLVASKLKKIGNPNTRDILMNDMHNLIFRACMADRLEQQSASPHHLSPN